MRVTRNIILCIYFCISIAGDAFAQARLMLGNGTAVYMNIAGGAYLVVGDATASAAPNTITRAANAWIVSEGNGTTNNRLKWYIGDAVATTAYTVPFGRSTTDYIPLTLTIGSAGVGDGLGGGAGVKGSFTFSTYRTTNCTNSGNLPATGTFPPTNYDSPAYPGDVSLGGVDRFWEIDGATTYDTKPDFSDLVFSYINAEVTGITCSNSSINETDIQAKRWDFSAATPSWDEAIFFKGTSTPASDIVTLTGAAVVSGPNDIAKSRWWTLVDNAPTPLPVEWLRYSAECNSGDVTIKWSTASEQNADYFTVERSTDGTSFSTIKHVLASGNSSTIKNYSAIDTEPYSGLSYYRVRETDFNGSYMTTNFMTVNGCSNDNIFIYGSVGGFSVDIDATEDAQYTFELHDMLGNKLMNEMKTVSQGGNHLKIYVSDIASAIYVAKVYSSSNAVTKKIFIRAAAQ